MSAPSDAFDGDLAQAAQKVIGPDGPLAQATHGRPALAIEIMDLIFDGRYLMLADQTLVCEYEPGVLRRALDADSIIDNLMRLGLVRCVWSDERLVKTTGGHRLVYPLTITVKGATIAALWHSFSPLGDRD